MTHFAQIKQVLSRHPEIRLAYVFGSVATGGAGADSDLDLAVQADAPLDAEARVTLSEELAEATGRAVDLVDLSTAGEPLLGEVLRGVRLRGDNSGHAGLLRRHILDTEDFLPYVRRMLAERRRTWNR